MWVSPYDIEGAMRIFAPVEIVLTLATVAAVAEAYWVSLDYIPRVYRWAAWAGLLSFVFWGVSAIQPELSGNWYQQFLELRTNTYLGLAILSAIAFVISLTNKRPPRAVRMHMGIFAALMIGHVLIVDWQAWRASNISFRLFFVVACGGWVVNSQFLRRERDEMRQALAVLVQALPALPVASRVHFASRYLVDVPAVKAPQSRHAVHS